MTVADTRLIQTAVLGHVDSDRPVILPEQAGNLDAFREHFRGQTFWCGALLGGCGAQLITKRYEEKVCHFAHLADADGARTACNRTTSNSAADHLFLKEHVSAWLAQQGIPAEATLHRAADGTIDEVGFWLPTARWHLRCVLHPRSYGAWHNAHHELLRHARGADWVFTENDPLLADAAACYGYGLTMRWHTLNHTRAIQIGTREPLGQTHWCDLHECTLSEHGLETPTAQRLRADGKLPQISPTPASLPLRGDQLHLVSAPGASAPADSPLAAPSRYLITADVKPTGSRVLRAYVSLPDTVAAPTEHHVYQLHGPARLLLTEPGEDGVRFAITAEGLSALNALEAERTGLWRPPVSVETLEDDTPRPATPGPASKDTENTHRDTLKSGTVSYRLRAELRRVAAQCTTTSWEKLAKHTQLDLAHLSDAKRRDLLVTIDQSSPPSAPLLSSLVRDRNGRVLPYMNSILRMLAIDAPVSDAALTRWCHEHTRQAHAHYSRAFGKKRPSQSAPTATQQELQRARAGAATRAVELRSILKQAHDLDLSGTESAEGAQQSYDHYTRLAHRETSTEEWKKAGEAMDRMRRALRRKVRQAQTNVRFPP